MRKIIMEPGFNIIVFATENGERWAIVGTGNGKACRFAVGTKMKASILGKDA